MIEQQENQNQHASSGQDTQATYDAVRESSPQATRLVDEYEAIRANVLSGANSPNELENAIHEIRYWLTRLAILQNAYKGTGQKSKMPTVIAAMSADFSNLLSLAEAKLEGQAVESTSSANDELTQSTLTR